MADEDQKQADLETSKRRQALKAKFAYANFAAGIVSAFAGGVANLTFGKLDELRKAGDVGVNFVSQLHWLVFFTSAIVLYALACLLVAKYSSNQNGPVRSVFRVPSWVELRNFGNQRVARVSYFALAVLPIAIWFVSENPFKVGILHNLTVPLNFKISFFVSFFVSIALILFTIGCPKEFLYKNVFEGTKNVNLVFGTADRSVVHVTQNEPDFYDEALDFSKLELRATCWLFYLLGLSFSIVLLFRAARLVLYA